MANPFKSLFLWCAFISFSIAFLSEENGIIWEVWSHFLIMMVIYKTSIGLKMKLQRYISISNIDGFKAIIHFVVSEICHNFDIEKKKTFEIWYWKQTYQNLNITAKICYILLQLTFSLYNEVYCHLFQFSKNNFFANMITFFVKVKKLCRLVSF